MTGDWGMDARIGLFGGNYDIDTSNVISRCFSTNFKDNRLREKTIGMCKNIFLIEHLQTPED